MTPRLGFGLVARDRDRLPAIESMGVELEALGYDELWANDNSQRSGLATLAAAARGADALLLGLGVAPLSDRGVAEIAAEVDALGIRHERLMLGVGTGSGSSLGVVRDAVSELRSLLPEVQMCIAALGPRMCRLGGEIADVVLLNWSYPVRVVWSRERIAEGARVAGRAMPRVASYVRVATGPDAADRLAGEADRYRGRPRPYSRLFEDQDAREERVPGIAAIDPAAVPALLVPYRAALDSCIVRALPRDDSRAALLEIARAAAASR